MQRAALKPERQNAVHHTQRLQSMELPSRSFQSLCAHTSPSNSEALQMTCARISKASTVCTRQCPANPTDHSHCYQNRKQGHYLQHKANGPRRMQS
eukprot:24530_4